MKQIFWLLLPLMYGGLLIVSVLTNHTNKKSIRALNQNFDPKIHEYAFVLPQVKPVFGAGLRASDCARCHQTIYKDWRQSSHAQALTDIQFQSELGKKSSPKWICLNCHIPLQNQRTAIVTGLEGGDIFKPVYKKNPGFDAKLQSEGVSCATCHIRGDSSGNSFIYGPNGSLNAPHPVKKDKEMLHNICERCHTPKGESITPNLSCWFATIPEMKESQLEIKKKFGQNKHCVDCHMPSEKGHLADNYSHLPKRNLNRHFWPGGGIPKRFSGFDSILNRGYQSGLKIKSSFPVSWKEDSRNTVSLKIQNHKAGHYLPTGDPERFISIQFFLKNKNKTIDAKTYRIGQIWEWNPARKISDNRLKFAEIRKLDFHLKKQKSFQGQKLEIIVLLVKVTRSNMNFLQQGHKNINENYLPGGKDLTKRAFQYYPAAVYLHFEEFDLQTGSHRIANSRELIKMSKQQKDIPVNKRPY